MYVVLTLFSIIPLLVAGQVVKVYLVEGADLRAQAKRQSDTDVAIPTMRGAILDRMGRILVVNTARYDIEIDPSVPGFKKAAPLFFEKLSRMTGRPVSELERRVRRRSSPQYVRLLRNISQKQKEAVTEWHVPGLMWHPRFGRRYNYGETTAHVLGRVDSDLRGLAGLELQYDSYLKGLPGRREVRRDRRGVLKATPDGVRTEPRQGESLVLTIDLVRQTILEEELARGVAESGAKWGTAIAMNPNTGAILAMANVPTFDPNRQGSPPSEAQRNRAVTDRIEPGSTFKLVTAVAAVEQGVVSMEDSIDTGEGWMVIHGRTLKDTHAHGTITFSDVIALSSNVGTAKVAMKMEPGVFYQYARSLGFGQKTSLDLPGEVPGKLKKPSEWSGTTLTSMSRGYEVDATPIQILTAYCALANGGLLVRPYVVAERRDVTGRTVWRAKRDSIRRAFNRETAQKLLPAFEGAVEHGTARKAQLAGLRVAGKTGTAIKVRNGHYDRSAYRASFIGFYPAERPKVALLVLVDEPRSSIYGGSVAAPVFQRTALRWMGTFPKIAQHMTRSEPPSEPSQKTMVNVIGQPAPIAVGQLLAKGYRVDEPGEFDRRTVVVRQRPDAGQEVLLGTRVHLSVTADTTRSKMPNLKGLSLRHARYWLASQGVDVAVEGGGTVAAQSPRAGKSMPEHAVLLGWNRK